MIVSITPSIQQLATALCQTAIVQIIVPDRGNSASNSLIMKNLPLRTQAKSNGDVNILSGISTDYVYIGINILILPSWLDIVAFNMKARLNFGYNMFYSSIGVTPVWGYYLDYLTSAISLKKDTHHFAVAVTCCLLRILISKPLCTSRNLNINILNLPLAKLIDFKVAYYSRYHSIHYVIRQKDQRDKKISWIRLPGASFYKSLDTDFSTVNQGYISITPVNFTTIATQPVLNARLSNTEVGVSHGR